MLVKEYSSDDEKGDWQEVRLLSEGKRSRKRERNMREQSVIQKRRVWRDVRL